MCGSGGCTTRHCRTEASALAGLFYSGASGGCLQAADERLPAPHPAPALSPPRPTAAARRRASCCLTRARRWCACTRCCAWRPAARRRRMRRCTMGCTACWRWAGRGWLHWLQGRRVWVLVGWCASASQPCGWGLLGMLPLALIPAHTLTPCAPCHLPATAERHGRRRAARRHRAPRPAVPAAAAAVAPAPPRGRRVRRHRQARLAGLPSARAQAGLVHSTACNVATLCPAVSPLRRPPPSFGSHTPVSLWFLCRCSVADLGAKRAAFLEQLQSLATGPAAQDVKDEVRPISICLVR